MVYGRKLTMSEQIQQSQKVINPMTFLTKKSIIKLIIICLVCFVVLFVFIRKGSRADTGATFTAKKGNLVISVLQGGSVEALESQQIRSEIKGYQGTRILNIVEEGYLVTEDDVKNGKILVELDSSDLEQRIITQEVQFQSTLSTYIEAQKAYEIQLNQNESDLKAAELNVRFALMDLEKYLGDKLANEIVKMLGLELKPFSYDLEAEETELLEAALTQPTDSKNSQFREQLPFQQSPGFLSRTNQLQGADAESGPRPLRRPGQQQMDAPARFTNQFGADGSTNVGPRRMRPSRQQMSGTNGQSAFRQEFPMSNQITNLPKKEINSPVTKTNPAPAIKIDFTKYADTNLLGDGAAMQQLRNLQNNLILAQQELSLNQIHYEGSLKLYTNKFLTKNELDNEELSVKKSRLQVQRSQTELDLFIKYEFPKTAEDYLSKYEEALRSLERTRKEALSKLAQARARLKSAENRFRIERSQLEDLRDQYQKCKIKALRPGLVVYGGGDDRRFYSDEQIREGATVRERQVILTIPDMTQMAVILRIHESQIKKVRLGQRARIRVDAFPEIELEGEVIKVGVLPDSQNRFVNPDMKVYPTTVKIKGVYEWLKPGMSAQVEIFVNELKDVIYVPIQAVFPINGKQYCFLAKGIKPQQCEVQVGEFNDEFIEIKSGINVGDRVLLKAPVGVEIGQIAKEDTTETKAPENTRAPQQVQPNNNNIGTPRGRGRNPGAGLE